VFEIRALYLKPRPGAAMQPVPEVTGRAGAGLVGDGNADPASPRQILLIARSAVRALGLADPDLRANLVVDGDLHLLSSGSVLELGDLRLRVTIPCEPCRKLEHVRPGLSREVGAGRGLLARVLSSGALHVGSRGRLSPSRAAPLHASWRSRVLDILAQVPEGKVVTYAALATVAGVQPAYCRALPAVLRSAPGRALPIHRVVPADVSKVDAAHRQQLLAEGADLRAPADCSWNGADYYSAQEAHLATHARAT
jgi:alkylated DNA nucleotide flippase Atl1